jgi:hypothetical protein
MAFAPGAYRTRTQMSTKEHNIRLPKASTATPQGVWESRAVELRIDAGEDTWRTARRLVFTDRSGRRWEVPEGFATRPGSRPYEILGEWLAVTGALATVPHVLHQAADACGGRASRDVSRLMLRLRLRAACWRLMFWGRHSNEGFADYYRT